MCGAPMDMTSNLLERSELLTRTDEEYELHGIVWGKHAPPRRQGTPATVDPALSSTLLHSSAPHVLRMHHPDAA